MPFRLRVRLRDSIPIFGPNCVDSVPFFSIFNIVKAFDVVALWLLAKSLYSLEILCHVHRKIKAVMIGKKHIIDFRIRWTWHSISRLYNDLAKSHNATTSKAFTILNIEKNGTLSTQLGPKMGMESRSLTRSLKGMLDLKLIRKKTDPKDKRKVRIYLTKKGIEYRKIASKNVKKFNETVFSKISKEELDSFYKVMDAIDQSIEELKK
jgi:DNA-binding MarR family transcriptional regulator